MKSLSAACFCIAFLAAFTDSTVSASRELKQTAAAPSLSAALMSIMTSTDNAMMAVPACSSVDIYFAETMIPHHQGAITMAEWELKYGSNPQLLNISASIISSQTGQIMQFTDLLASMPKPADCTPSAAPMMGMDSMSMAPAVLSPGASKMMATMNSDMAMDGSMTMMAAPTMAMGTPSPAMDMSSMTPSMDMSSMTPSMDMSSMTPSMDMSSMDMAPSPAQLNGNPDRDFALEMMMHHQAAVDMANVEIQYGSSAPIVALAGQIVDTQSAEINDFKMILSQDYATATA